MYETNDTESASTESAGRGKEPTMNEETTIWANTPGDFCTGRERARTKKVRPLDDGCYWFARCEGCGWEGCVTTCVVKYGSAKAALLRGEAFERMLREGIPMAWLTRFFGLAEEQVTAEARPFERPPTKVHDRKAEAIRRRQAGEAEMSVAQAMGVSARMVRLWCQGAAGIRRPHWDRPQGVAEATIMPAENAIRARCEVLRALFK